MQDGVRFAQTQAEKKAAYQLRYRVYVEDMGRFRDAANHDIKELIDDLDAGAETIVVIKSGVAIGSMRVLWGGSMQLPEKIIDLYCLAPFLGRVKEKNVCVIERLMVDEKHRGSSATLRMYKELMRFVLEQGIEAVFLECEPNQLTAYMKLGFRPLATTRSYPGVGLAVPMVLISGDYHYLQQIGSPFAALTSEDVLSQYRHTSALLELIIERCVMSQATDGSEVFMSEVYADAQFVEKKAPGLFDRLNKEEVSRIIEKGHIITCAKGDHVIEKKNARKTLFVVLSGIISSHPEEPANLGIYPGEVIGESSFLLNCPRPTTLVAKTDRVKILSLDESIVSRILKFEPILANKIITNIGRTLCFRLSGWSSAA